MSNTVDRTICIWALFLIGVLLTIYILQYPTFDHLVDNKISSHHSEILSEAEQANRRIALENLHNMSLRRQKEIQQEDETILKKISSNEFVYLDNGIRHKILKDWDYDYWLAENSSDYYAYYLAYGLTVNAAVVIGIAHGASSERISNFVVSLRNTGYVGRIIVAIDENIDKNTIDLLQGHGVETKYLYETNCTHQWANSQQLCIDPYPSVIPEWSRIPLARDYLLACYRKNECTDAVLIADISNTFFQRNPFGAGARFIAKLELFEENPHIDVKTSIVRERILSCTGWDIRNRPMISADSVIGPIEMVISFLDHVYNIMQMWMQNPNCVSQFHRNDDLKGIFNFMRLSGSIPTNVTYYSHRTGLVNNVGYDGSRILQSHIYFQQFRGYSIKEAMSIPFEGSNGSRWIGNDYLLVDDDGYFVDLSVRRSHIVHQYDTFGPTFLSWLDKNLKKPV